MKKNYTVKGILANTELSRGATKGKQGVFIGAKNLTLECNIGNDLVAVAEQIVGTRLSVEHFGFDVGEYFAYVSEDNNWRKASVVCTPTGLQIDSATYKIINQKTGQSYTRFAHLRHFIVVEACFFLDSRKQPVCIWDLIKVGFEKDSKGSNTIKIQEFRESLTMPAKLAERFVMVYCGDPLPKREDLVTQISQHLSNKTNMSEEIKTMFLKLADVLALTYLNAWGAKESLAVAPYLKAEVPVPTPEPKTTISATETKPESKDPAPVAEESETEEDLPVVVIAGGNDAVLTDPVDPQAVAAVQAAAGLGGKGTHRAHKGKR